MQHDNITPLAGDTKPATTGDTIAPTISGQHQQKKRLAEKVNALTESEAQAALELFQRLTLKDKQAVLAVLRAIAYLEVAA